ncbi:hypothetical protein ACCD08_14740 [Telluria sp. Tellsp104]
MTNASRFALVVVGFLLSSANAVAQQDRCASVLQEGIFQTANYRSNDYFKQIIYSRFLRSSYQSSKTDKGLGFGVPVGEIIMGGNYSEAEYNQKKAQLQSEYLNTITQTREIDVALSSGDTEVLKSWTTCMKNGSGGPTLTLAVLSPTEVQITVGFLSAPGSSMQLSESVAVPEGAEIVSGKNCLKNRTVIQAGASCIASVKLPSATTTWSPAVQTKKNGSAAAYLPARIELISEVRPYQLPNDCANLSENYTQELAQLCPHRLYHRIAQMEIKPAFTVTIPEALLIEGWYFDTASSRADLVVHYRRSPSGMSWCSDPWQRPTQYAFSYGYYAIGRWSGNDKSSVLVCSMTPQINLARQRWMPKKTISATLIPAAYIR